MARFVLFKNSSGRFAFRLVGDNGAVVLTGEQFESKAAATDAITALRTRTRSENSFERRSASNGEYYFVVTDENGRILARSEGYASQAGRETGIWSVRQNATSAKLALAP